MYIDYTLRFATQAEADGVLFDKLAPKYAAVDVIGTIYKPTGNMLTTEDGSTPEMTPIPGWHVNVRHNLEAPELVAYSIDVASPVRTWV